MPDLQTRSADNPEFARIVDVANLKGRDQFDFDLRPDEAEAAALARLLGVRGLRKLRFRGRIAPIGNGGWLLEADLSATVKQTCVVTLEAVTTRIEQPVRRRFLPDAAAMGREIIVSPDADEEIEPLADRIDLGLVAIEALALALPAYPRKPGAELEPRDYAPDDAAPLPQAEVKPFAALAALRGKLGNGG